MSLRIAVISAPRTGNTWLHHLLMDVYGISGFPVHTPGEVDWAGLPADCSVQIHWHRTPEFVRTLAETGFQVVTLVRHPLDVLISILQFSLSDSSTLLWLEGDCGDERPIYGAMPGSAAFRAYATGPRAATLLGVSREWWAAANGCGLRYEELVADTAGELARLTAALGAPPRRPVAEVIAGTTLPRMRARVGSNHHFWQGRPGLWKLLLTAPVAQEIMRAHAAYCEDFGYACDPDPQLTAAQADDNWIACLGSQVAERLQKERLQGLALKQSQAQCAQLEQANGLLHAELADLAARHADVQAELTYYQNLGWFPDPLRKKLRGLAQRYPGAASAFNRAVRRGRAA
jgi:hypothetical protein